MSARILYASDDTEDNGPIADTLSGAGYELLTVKDGPEALRRWSVDRPDLLVLDGSLPGVDGHEVVLRIRAAELAGTHLPVILVGAEDGLEAKVTALRAGADEYLVKPVHAKELAARAASLLVRFVPADRTPSGNGRVHAWYGAKGGVGTTTLAINTAIALGRDGKTSVALVDGNLHFGDHRMFLDLGREKHSIVDVCTATGIDADIVRRYMVTHKSGVELMLAPSVPEAADHVSTELHQLLQVVEVLRSMYDYVVVDLDNRLDDHTLDVVTTADTLFVVMTADLPSLKNVRLVLDTMAQIGVPDDRIELVLNRSNANTGISQKSAENALRRRIMYHVVNDYRTAIASLNSGTPFMSAKSDASIAKDVMALAAAIREPAAKPAPAEMPSRRMVHAYG